MTEDARPYSERPSAMPDPARIEAQKRAAESASASRRGMTPVRWFYLGLILFSVLLFGSIGILTLIHSIS